MTTNRAAVLIGAPTDIGASDRGASMGPEALRVAGLGEALRNRGIEVIDRGNLTGPANPWQPPTEGYRHLAQVADWNRLIYEAIRAELGAKRLPVLLGGDHCLAIGSISAVARHCRDTKKKLRVLWLDAHADFNTSQLSPSGNIHGMPVSCLCGFGPRELTGLSGISPAISPKVDSPDRHPQRRPGRKALRARAGARSVRHALHRRVGHAAHDAAGAGRNG